MKRLNERIDQTLSLTESEQADGVRRVSASGLTANVVNANRRRYRRNTEVKA